jgi:hypothetical protein
VIDVRFGGAASRGLGRRETIVKLKDFQSRFQRAILDGDDAILDDIPDGPRETNVNLLGVYRDAYVLRLIDVVGSDHELLRRYLGEDRFRCMAALYRGLPFAPSQRALVRAQASRIPENEPALFGAAHHRRACDAGKALNDAFDSADAPVLGMSDLAAVPPEAWARCPSSATAAACLEVFTNVARLDGAQGRQGAATARFQRCRAHSGVAARFDSDVPRARRRGGDGLGAIGQWHAFLTFARCSRSTTIRRARRRAPRVTSRLGSKRGC